MPSQNGRLHPNSQRMFQMRPRSGVFTQIPTKCPTSDEAKHCFRACNHETELLRKRKRKGSEAALA
eukprot:5549889-Amphidinium_carterae.1